MAIIDKKFIHFKNYDDFISQAGVGSVANITTPTSGSEDARNAVYGQIKGSSIVFIKDTKQIWTHGQLYSGNVDISTLSDVLRVDSESILNKDRVTVSGEYTNENGDAVAYSYGNSDQGLLLTNTYTTQDALKAHVFTVDNGIELGTIKTYDKQDQYNTTHATASGIYVADGGITLNNVAINQDQFTQIFCVMNDGNFGIQRVVEGSENLTPISTIILTETGVTLASGFANSEQGHSLVITPEGILLNGQYLDKYISISYDNLKTLRNNSQLIPGAMYRITDYETQLLEYDVPDEESGAEPEHVLWGSGFYMPAVDMSLYLKKYYFDIVVVALSSNEISEQAYAVHSARDVEGHFTNRNLSAWKVYYRLENKHDFWFVPKTAKGVIYKLVNEYGNEAPYDFENVHYGHIPVFGMGCTNNILEGYYITLGNYCHDNYIGKNSVRIKIGSYSKGNTFGVKCRGIVLGSYCNYNTFGNNCVYLYDSDYGTFGGGFWINQSTPRNYCSHNTFANGCAPHLECSASATAARVLQHLCILTNSHSYWDESGCDIEPELKYSAAISLPIDIINAAGEIRVGANSQGKIRIYRLEDLIN